MFKVGAMRSFVVGLSLLFSIGVALAAESKTSNGKLSSADSDFVKDAVQGGMLEVELGKLAQEKAADPKVKQFGQKMEQDHRKANGELKKIATDKGMQLSSELDKKHKSKVDKLSKLSGVEFDRQYIQAMVSDHKDVLKNFQRQSEKSKDADLKQFASQTLPTLKEHLQLAESTAKEVKASGKSTKNSKTSDR